MTTGTTGESADVAAQTRWAIPLIVLIPVAAIGLATSLSTPWRMVAWPLWGVAAALTVAGWVQVRREGGGGAAGWVSCLLLHGVLVWQAVRLLVG
ncbi:hypothetical protein [Streptomyces coffeae]|uniref:Uncharacterized protein n=1 Tax=Streptomyces coffeae TaxID=621382 RepID=A0ABS1NQA2_9ACTN|nr:hypothetical protein [Streptomyces coffeae]MBL1102271.1 hypothetical protein [Streptomyces coffeae]